MDPAFHIVFMLARGWTPTINRNISIIMLSATGALEKIKINIVGKVSVKD